MNKFRVWSTVSFISLGIIVMSVSRLSHALHDVEIGDEEHEESRATSYLLNKKTKKMFLKMFRRRINIPEDSVLSLNLQVSRPNLFPGIWSQEEGFIVDGVLEWPMWLELDELVAVVLNNTSTTSDTDGFTGDSVDAKSTAILGVERCLIYKKVEWVLGFVTQLSAQVSHSCLLKFICETHTIHSYYPDLPLSIVFELIHLILTPSFGAEDTCHREYIGAENFGRMYGRCDSYEAQCPYSFGGILIRNFFPQWTKSDYRPEQDNKVSAFK